MNKQTAVEFLVDNFHYYYSTKWNDIVQQAKEMEKQQIIDAHGNQQKKSGGVYNYTYILTGEKYYNETFKL